MCFCFSDIQGHNFIFTDSGSGSLYIIDFGHAAFLPLSFMAYPLMLDRYWLSDNIRYRVGLTKEELEPETNENLIVMSALQYLFGTGRALNIRTIYAGILLLKHLTNIEAAVD